MDSSLPELSGLPEPGCYKGLRGERERGRKLTEE